MAIDIKDDKDMPKFKVQWSTCQGSILFPGMYSTILHDIMDEPGNTKIGSVYRTTIAECCKPPTCGFYVELTKPDLTHNDKVLIYTAVQMIDYLYYAPGDMQKER